MKKIFVTFLAIMSIMALWAQNPEAYVLYNQNGKQVKYSSMIKDMSKMDIVFIGEIHNCAIAHWMEKLIISDLYDIHGKQLMLGAEMFERDNQILLNEYINGLVPESKFKAEAKLWDNYANDYSPIVEIAKKDSLAFIATNVPRRYANMVSKGGFEALNKLSKGALQFIAPLPIQYIPNPIVDNYFANMMVPDMKAAKVKMPNMKAMVLENLSKAQAVKDATMAWSISESLQGKMVHVNGSFHSTGHAGIISYLNVYRPGLKIGTIEIVHQDSVEELAEENKGKADYIICVPSSMARTF